MAVARSVRSLAFVTACVLSCACATSRYSESRIQAVPPGVPGEAGSSASLEIEGLKLVVRPLDRTAESEATRSLTLRVEFDPPELGYSFDPGQVRLRTPDGREWHAAGGGYLPLFPNATFDLAFDVVVEPGRDVDLVLDGLARGRKRLEPVTLPLARHSGRSIDRLYWLEAIGYAMAVLTYPYGGM